MYVYTCILAYTCTRTMYMYCVVVVCLHQCSTLYMLIIGLPGYNNNIISCVCMYYVHVHTVQCNVHVHVRACMCSTFCRDIIQYMYMYYISTEWLLFSPVEW